MWSRLLPDIMYDCSLHRRVPAYLQGKGGEVVEDKLTIGGSDVVSVDSVLDLRHLQRVPSNRRDWHVRRPL